MRCRPKFAGLLAMSLCVGCASTPGEGPRRDAQSAGRRPAPKITEPAPMFKLASLDGKRNVDLADYRGDKPVLLFFGSYT